MVESPLKKLILSVKSPLKKLMVSIKSSLKKLKTSSYNEAEQGVDYYAETKNGAAAVGLEEYRES